MLEDRLQYDKLKNVREQRKEWLENIKENLPIIDSHGWRSFRLKGLLSKFSSVIIGAGPCLEQNKHLLSEVKGKLPILTTDRAWAKIDVQPDFVLTLDHLQVVDTFFDGLDTEKSCLVASVTCNPLIFKRKWRKVFPILPSDQNEEYAIKCRALLSSRRDIIKVTPGLVNVGNFGIWLSGAELKCATTCGIGFDYCYYSPVENIAQTKVYVEELGKDIWTGPAFTFGARSLKETIKKHNFDFVNASEAGVLYGEGIRKMTFRDFIDSTVASNKSIETLLKQV